MNHFIRATSLVSAALGLALIGIGSTMAASATSPRATAPQIDSVSPGMGGPGDRIEITGRGFSDGGSPATVTFLSTPATVAEFTDSAMTVIVPTIANPPEGFVELKVSNSAGSDIAPFRYYAAPPGEVSEPVGLKARPSKGKVTLTWSPPTRGSALVTSYQWRSQLRGAIKWSDWKTVAKGPAAKSQVVKRIRPKQTYVFQVRAMAGSVTGPAATVSARGK
ncbi:MAG: hypothetical protein RL347_335 [Actinomycetota bacterium]